MLETRNRQTALGGARQEQGFRGDASITEGVEPTRARRAARSDATKAERSSDWPVSRGVRIKWLMSGRAGFTLLEVWRWR